MQNTNHLIPKLNELIHANQNAEYSYREASNLAGNAHLSEMFKMFAERRYHFCNDLRGEIIRLEGFVDFRKKFVKELEKLWMRLKSLLTSNDQIKLLDTCKSIEIDCWEQYNEVLSITPLPDKTRKMLEKHKANLDEALYQIIEMQETMPSN